MIDKKQTLKKLIQDSAILPKQDKKIIISQLQNFSDEKIKQLISLLTNEQDKIRKFAVNAKKIKSEYNHAFAKDCSILHEKAGEHESSLAENLLNENLKQI